MDKRRAMMEEYRRYREAALQSYQEQKSIRLELRGGVDTDELDSNVDDWEEETIEFFINEEIIPLGDRLFPLFRLVMENPKMENKPLSDIYYGFIIHKLGYKIRP